VSVALSKILLFSVGGLVIVIALAALFVAGRLENANRNYIRINTRGLARKPGISSEFEALYEKPVIGIYLKWVRSQLFLGGTSTTDNLITKSVLLGSGSILTSIITFLVLVRLYQANLWIMLLFGVCCIYLNSMIIRSFAGNSDTRLLTAMVDYVGDVKHFYHATAMVGEAIKQANLRAAGEMLNQGTRIYNILTGSNPEYMLKEYYETCSNKFLKIFAGFSYLVQDFGDKKIEGISLYIKNLNYITEEIQIEIIKKNQLAYWLRGLNIIVLFPLLLPPVIESWMRSGFPIVSVFYDSSTGFYLRCSIFLVIVVCYAFIVQIQKTEQNAKAFYKRTWDYYLNRIGIIRFFVNLFAPRQNTAKYRKMKSFLEDDAGSAMPVEGLYLRRLIFGLSAFIIILLVFSSGHRTNVEKIIADTAYGIDNANFFRMMGKLDEEELLNEIKIKELDVSIIKKIGSMGLSKAEDILAAAKAELISMNYDGEDQELTAQRICMKIIDSKKEYIQTWEVLASLLAAGVASWFPMVLLAFQASLRKVDMEDEVFQFHTIIILLMHHDNVDVKVVLEWMKEFANIFRAPIELCLTNFQNQNLALEKLKEDVKFKPFGKIIDNLQMANEDISLIAAFDALELEREFYKESRKESNKQQVNKKIEFGQLIGFIPVYAVLLLYMALPIIVTSFTAFSSIQKQLI
jgi:hypothetical protein